MDANNNSENSPDVPAGVGGVNNDGEVMLFVDVEIRNLTHYTCKGDMIILSGRGEPHEARYGERCREVALTRQDIQVTQLDVNGQEVASKRLRRRDLA